MYMQMYIYIYIYEKNNFQRGYGCGCCPPSSACQAGHLSACRLFTPPAVYPHGDESRTLGISHWRLASADKPLQMSLLLVAAWATQRLLRCGPR